MQYKMHVFEQQWIHELFSRWVMFACATAATKTVVGEQSLVQLRTASNPQHCRGRRLVLVSFFKLSFFVYA